MNDEFRARARRFGKLLNELQESEERLARLPNGAHRPPVRNPKDPEPFDCYDAIGYEGRAAVNKLLKTQCGTARRKRFPEGPSRRTRAQGGGRE